MQKLIAERAKSIFFAAIEKPSANEQRHYIDEACGKDVELHDRVQALLAAHLAMGSINDLPPSAAKATPDEPGQEHVGSLIGRYKLLEQIGEGGMGVVFVAEQTEPVRRRVALKIIKPGMDTKQVIARFEAERQALAMMDHPNIARVLDAGTTELGRPYFVMDLIRGIPITEYCDQAKLDPRKRLELFVTVCQAIQHAHQKGIIHRDLKPPNILVTLHGGVPVVKVIDFGIAKAVSQQLTERTIYTALTQLIGTPLYMSPEQAEMSGLDVDTRSDVYSLGVLLYELLTGHTPFDKETIGKAGLDEIRRIVREHEPLRPSRRIGTLGVEAISTVSQHRGLDERKLGQMLRGELDWIVMKSLEKDRERRYESASALARDVGRFLNSELVQACPPSNVYRFRKFAAKHRPTLITAAVVSMALLIGTVLSTWQAVQAAQARNDEIKQRQRAEDSEKKAKDRLAETERQRKEAQKNFEAALDAVDRMLGHVDAEEFQDLPRVGPVRRRILQDAIAFYERIPLQASLPAETRARMAQNWSRIADLSGNLEATESARSARQTAVSITAQLVSENPDNPKYLAMLAKYQMALCFQSSRRQDFQAAENASRMCFDLYTRLLNQDPTEPVWLMMRAESSIHLSDALGQLGKREEAIAEIRRALDMLHADPPRNGVFRSDMLFQLAKLQSVANPEESDDLYRQSIAEKRNYFANGEASLYQLPVPFGMKAFYSPEGTRRGFGNLLRSVAQAFSSRHPAESEQLLDESISVWRAICIPSHHRRNDFTTLATVLLERAQNLRRQASDSRIADDAERDKILLNKADALVQEALSTQRYAVSRFVVEKSRMELVQMLRAESQYLSNQIAKADASQTKDIADRNLQADALITEAVQLCRQLNAEFPKESKYRDILAACLADQAKILRRNAANGDSKESAVKLEKAIGLFNEATALQRQILRDNPADHKFSDRFVISLQEWATCLTQQAAEAAKRSEQQNEAALRKEAIALLREAISVETRVADALPQGPWYRNRLVYLYQSSAQLQFEIAKMNGAESTSEDQLAMLKNGDELFMEAIKNRRQLAGDFPSHEFDFRTALVKLLYQHSLCLQQRAQGELGKDKPDESRTWLTLADALLTEGIQLCRTLTAEFPDNAEHKSRLDEMLKVQAQHFRQKPDPNSAPPSKS